LRCRLSGKVFFLVVEAGAGHWIHPLSTVSAIERGKTRAIHPR
jgi:hypothetical protein